MPLLRQQGARLHERATLWYSYSGEFGRGLFAALCLESALVLAISVHDVDNKILLWMLTSAGFFGMLFPIFASPLTASHRKKSVVVSVETVSRVLVVFAAFAPNGLWFVILMASGIAINAFGIPMVSGIYGENFRSEIRGRAVGRLHAVSMGTATVTGAVAYQALNANVQFYRPLILTVAALSLASSWYAYKTPEPRKTGNSGPAPSFSSMLGILRKDRAFAYIEVFWFLVGSCNLLLVPLKVLYMEDLDKFKPGHILLATATIMFATQVVFLPFWGRIIYRVNFAFYRMSISVLFILGMALFFFSSSFPLICLGSFFWALGLSGGVLSWRLVATFFTRPENVAQYMCVHSFLCGIRGVLAPLLALHLWEICSIRFVLTLSLSGLVVSIAMLVPMIGMLQRRRHLLESQSRRTPPDSEQSL